jgi:hypothetical protein
VGLTPRRSDHHATRLADGRRGRRVAGDYRDLGVELLTLLRDAEDAVEEPCTRRDVEAV